MNSWTPRDWRVFTGIVFLSLGGVACTALGWQALTLLAARSTSPWPVAYFAYGCLILIGIVLLGLSAILGRRTFKFRVGDNEVEATGEDAERVLDNVEETR